MKRTHRSLAVGSIAGLGAAALSPGALGVVSGSAMAFGIPVFGQIALAGTIAAAIARGVSDEDIRKIIQPVYNSQPQMRTYINFTLLVNHDNIRNQLRLHCPAYNR